MFRLVNVNYKQYDYDELTHYFKAKQYFLNVINMKIEKNIFYNFYALQDYLDNKTHEVANNLSFLQQKKIESMLSDDHKKAFYIQNCDKIEAQVEETHNKDLEKTYQYNIEIVGESWAAWLEDLSLDREWNFKGEFQLAQTACFTSGKVNNVASWFNYDLEGYVSVPKSFIEYPSKDKDSLISSKGAKAAEKAASKKMPIIGKFFRTIDFFEFRQIWDYCDKLIHYHNQQQREKGKVK